MGANPRYITAGSLKTTSIQTPTSDRLNQTLQGWGLGIGVLNSPRPLHVHKAENHHRVTWKLIKNAAPPRTYKSEPLGWGLGIFTWKERRGQLLSKICHLWARIASQGPPGFSKRQPQGLSFGAGAHRSAQAGTKAVSVAEASRALCLRQEVALPSALPSPPKGTQHPSGGHPPPEGAHTVSRPPLYPCPGQGQVQTVLTHTIVASLTKQMDALSPQGWAHLSPRFCGRHASPHSRPPCSNLERPCPSASCQLPAILRGPLTPPKDPADSSLPAHSASNGMTGGRESALLLSHPCALCQPQTVERGHPPGSTPNRAGSCENASWRNPHLVASGGPREQVGAL